VVWKDAWLLLALQLRLKLVLQVHLHVELMVEHLMLVLRFVSFKLVKGLLRIAASQYTHIL